MITIILAGDTIFQAFDKFARYLANNSLAYQRDIAQASHYMARFNVNANIIKNFREDHIVKNENFHSELRTFYNALRLYTRYYLSIHYQYDEPTKADDIFEFITTHLNTAQEIESFCISYDSMPREHITVAYSPHIAATLMGWSTTLLMLGSGYYMTKKDTDEPNTMTQNLGYACLMLTAYAAGQAVTYFTNYIIDPPTASKKQH